MARYRISSCSCFESQKHPTLLFETNDADVVKTWLVMLDGQYYAYDRITGDMCHSEFDVDYCESRTRHRQK